MKQGGSSFRRSDEGQLMLLAGIVLTISFILTALTLSQVSALEREAASEGPNPIVSEWRFLHERLGSNLKTAVGVDTSKETFRDSILATVQATFRSVMSEKGYDLTIRLAGDPTLYATTGYERQLMNVAETTYEDWSWDGRVEFDHTVDPSAASDKEDGIIWQKPCPDASGPAAGCIGGVYLYVRLTDGTATLEESILFGVNQ